MGKQAREKAERRAFEQRRQNGLFWQHDAEFNVYTPQYRFGGHVFDGDPRPYPHLLKGEPEAIAAYFKDIFCEQVFGMSPFVPREDDDGNLVAMDPNPEWQALPFIEQIERGDRKVRVDQTGNADITGMFRAFELPDSLKKDG